MERKSHQREVILEELKKLISHPTAAILYDIVRKRLPKISLGTIYRNLELLTQEGIIQKLGGGSPEARFDGNVDKHYHIRCSQCGRVDDLHDFTLDIMKDKSMNWGGYKITGHHFEFVGICPDCMKREKTNNKATIN
jgi:Fur family ferric uptake transcriptional regulator